MRWFKRIAIGAAILLAVAAIGLTALVLLVDPNHYKGPVAEAVGQQGQDLGELRLVRGTKKAEMAGAIALCPPSSLKDTWTRNFPDPLAAFASGWMRVRARARQKGVELPLVISDHADWDGLTATIAATGASDIWVTHGAEEALVHWCRLQGLKARPLGVVGYGDEDEGDDAPIAAGAGSAGTTA